MKKEIPDIPKEKGFYKKVCVHLSPILEHLESTGVKGDNLTGRIDDIGSGSFYFVSRMDLDAIEAEFEIPKFISIDGNRKTLIVIGVGPI